MTTISGDLAIKEFGFGEFPVRVLDVSGDPWFVAKDVCEVLGITNTSDALTRLNGADVGSTEIRSGVQNRRVKTVNESGLYDLVLDSRKPEARAFRRWVTAEVLPTIRKTGGAYIQPDSQADIDLADPIESLNKLIEIATIARDERQKLVELEAAAAINAPKVAAYEALMDSEGNYSIGNVAQILGTGQNRLFRELRDMGILIATAGPRYNTPYQAYAHHFDVKASTFQHKSGDREATFTTKVRPSGLAYIAKRMGVII